MATLAGMLVADRTSEFDAGVALLLQDTPDVNAVVSIGEGWEVEIVSSSPYVVARGKDATVKDDQGNVKVDGTFALAYEAAQKGLDLFSIMGKADLAVRDAMNESLVWWREDGRQILRAIGTARTRFSVGITAEVLDEHGNPKPQPPIPSPQHHECLRYFRLAQVTEDLFDAYRNLWLSFELLISSRHPKRGREIDWLRDALTATHSSLDLTQGFTPTGSDVVSEIITDLYVGARLPLFHATAARTVFVPHSLQDRETVLAALKKLTRLLLFLIRQWLGARRIGGGMYSPYFDATIKALLVDAKLLVSDNDAPPDPAHANRAEAGLDAALVVVPQHVPELSDTGRQFWLGNMDAQELRGLRRIAGFFVEAEDTLHSYHTIEAELMHEGIDRLEAQVGFYLENVQEPKYFFTA